MSGYRIRRFTPDDRAPMLAFAHALPEHDLLFLGRDLKHPRVIEAWLSAIDDGWIDSLVAMAGYTVVGVCALVRDPLGWSAHVGEVRLLVASERRSAGLGRDLLHAVMTIAGERALTKLTATMTTDQAGAVALFESMGFRGEALLKNQVCSRDGAMHDIVILSHDAHRAATIHDAYGLEAG